MKLIIGISGASGSNYAISLLKELKERNIETHIIVSDWGKYVLKEETQNTMDEIKDLSTKVYENNDMAASISSSSFLVDGMIIIPASIKTCSEISTAHTSTLIIRCADNMLKTKKKLIVCLRETPLSTPALDMLRNLSMYGSIVLPLSPGFYHRPKTISDLEGFITGKILDLLEIENNKIKRWKDEF